MDNVCPGHNVVSAYSSSAQPDCLRQVTSHCRPLLLTTSRCFLIKTLHCPKKWIHHHYAALLPRWKWASSPSSSHHSRISPLYSLSKTSRTNYQQGIFCYSTPKNISVRKEELFSRTCRGVGEFVRNSENIVIPLKGEYCITTKSDGSVWMYHHHCDSRPIDLASCCGLRLTSLSLPCVSDHLYQADDETNRINYRSDWLTLENNQAYEGSIGEHWLESIWRSFSGKNTGTLYIRILMFLLLEKRWCEAGRISSRNRDEETYSSISECES